MSAISDGISKAIESAEGTISAERNIGKNKARGSIDAEGVWDIGIDFKVGGLGVTNDYGGAITVSIAGQSITWGREGGKIHYNVGGFEVVVEARDCVVTEQKIIMGIVVASHTYPDPGCEIPDPFVPLAPPLPPPEPDGTEKLGTGMAYVFCEGRVDSNWPHQIQYYPNVYLFSEGFSEVTIEGPNELDAAGRLNLSACIATSNYEHSRVLVSGEPPESWYTDGTLGTMQTVSTSRNNGWVSRPGGLRLYYFESFQVVSSVRNPSTFPIAPGHSRGQARIYLGEQANIKTEIKAYNVAANPPRNAGGVLRTETLKVTKVLPIVPVPTVPQPFLQPGAPPHMNDCCEDILDSLEDLKDVLHVEFFKKKKFPVPTYLLAPGCEPGKTTDAENYYHLFQKLFQTIAHTAIVSPQIDIQDADAVKEGDQKINERYLSATGWAEAVTKRLYEIEDDGNIATNMDIRTGVTVTQLLVAVADLSYKVDCIIDCIGITTKRSKAEVETSYNLVVEGENTKGFDPKKSNQQLDLNSDISTEKLLAGLLRTRKNPITKEEIHPKSPTLFEILNDLKNK